MSAEVLREAAALMRELADKASKQPVVKADVQGVWLNSRFYMVTTPDREYALADWLDAYAERMEVLGHVIGSNHGQALAVARAYLNTP